MKKKIFLTSTLFFIINVHSADYMFVLGGGGEPMTDKDGRPMRTTIFDTNLDNLGSYKKTRPDLNSKIIFNGGHAETEGIVAKHFNSNEKIAPVFEKEPLLNQIADYEAKIKSGQIKAGDKILIYIDSHGAIRSNNGELTHQISLGKSPLKNYDKLGGNIVSLDTLKNLTDLAAKSGVKIGILDFSCHSGNTIDLKNENTCVISSTGPNHYGYGGSEATFGGQFVKKMQKGKSLEEVYLSARSNFQDTSFPMISSPAGLEVHNELYNLITPYLYYFDDTADKLKPYVLKTASSKDICMDKRNFQELEEIVNKVDSLSSFLKDSEFSSSTAKDLKSYLKTYQQYIEDIKKQQIALGRENLKKREDFCTEYTIGTKTKPIKKKECSNYSWDQMVSIDYDNILKYFNEQLKFKKGNEHKEQLATIQNIQKAKMRSLELKAQYPDLKNLDTKLNELADKEKKTYDLAFKISKGLQKMYGDMYALKQADSEKKNPCKDFIL